MAVKGFTFYLTYADVASELSVENQGKFYRAICEFMFFDNDIEDELEQEAKIAFKCIKPNLKTSKKRSHQGSAGRKANSKVKNIQDEIKKESNNNQGENKNATRLRLSSISSSRSNKKQRCKRIEPDGSVCNSILFRADNGNPYCPRHGFKDVV